MVQAHMHWVYRVATVIGWVVSVAQDLFKMTWLDAARKMQRVSVHFEDYKPLVCPHLFLPGPATMTSPGARGC